MVVAQAPELKDSAVAEAIDARHAAWEAELPLRDDTALWERLSTLDQASRLALLAHCLSFGVNALHERVNPYGAGISASGLTRRMKHADMLAKAVDLDMVEAGWEPTAETYLSRVPKVRIIEAVREAKGGRAACPRGSRLHSELHRLGQGDPARTLDGPHREDRGACRSASGAAGPRVPLI